MAAATETEMHNADNTADICPVTAAEVDEVSDGFVIDGAVVGMASSLISALSILSGMPVDAQWNTGF
jgi:hypothetical protein